MNEIAYTLMMVAVMALVTYLIRMIPFVFFRKKIKSRFVNSLLYYLPYAVLAAMTFPSIFFVTSGNVPVYAVQASALITASVGTVTAIVAAIFKRSLVIVAICAVAAVLAVSVLFIFFPLPF
ncbi:MAG: AzlD domain-containing protein [Clostridia bacterium]|nr:AzlD domain-containing protein [Clostridia bacterium]